MKIYLSPSTQENNVGVNAYGTEEQRMNQETDILVTQLRGYGHTIKRNLPTMTLTQVVEDSNSFNPDLHVAIHSNANDGKSRGCLVFCHRFNSIGEKYARAIYKYLSAITPSSDLGVIEGVNYFGVNKPLYETAWTNAPAVLIEIAFHDNPDDENWIINNMSAIATAITNGINEVAGIMPIDNFKEKYEAIVTAIKDVIKLYGG